MNYNVMKVSFHEIFPYWHRDHRLQFQSSISARSSTQPNTQDLRKYWLQTKQGLKSETTVSDAIDIPGFSLSVGCSQICLPDITCSQTLKPMESQEKWPRTVMGREMKRAAYDVSCLSLYWLIKATGPRKPSVSEVIKGSDYSLINCHTSTRIWEQYFGERLIWTISTVWLPPTSVCETKRININSLKRIKVIRNMGFLLKTSVLDRRNCLRHSSRIVKKC